MSWLPAIALAGALFLIAAFALRLPRGGWAAFGAALLFGLAGYAFQANPDVPAAPKAAVPEVNETSAAMIEARRAMFDSTMQASDFVLVSDGFARRGQYADAAQMLRSVVRENPGHAEAWVALGNALVEHADGNLTRAAVYAYARAEQAAPGHPAAPYFHGLALLRAGRPREASALWAQAIAEAPAGAEWVEPMEQRLEKLEALIAAAEER
ncbi:tetratricopeptide repeat protein [Pelagerythrobacter rhizovicinus]|uniref:Tetratricopeptide repeat protein n=1 Tax=Pelagerythrobacter rhizovicinus TaxID=2268576 RepID=A0A4Q2KM69_9SPHN|nr:tetratricopeptide repeat protein [Pelagerythrobacter rhizovicinus]RXZ66434.1 tetratricopeptide repeat protein [Pelagerythrobacter rhizovicinus]